MTMNSTSSSILVQWDDNHKDHPNTKDDDSLPCSTSSSITSITNMRNVTPSPSTMKSSSAIAAAVAFTETKFEQPSSLKESSTSLSSETKQRHNSNNNQTARNPTPFIIIKDENTENASINNNDQEFNNSTIIHKNNLSTPTSSNFCNTNHQDHHDHKDHHPQPLLSFSDSILQLESTMISTSSSSGGGDGDSSANSSHFDDDEISSTSSYFANDNDYEQNDDDQKKQIIIHTNLEEIVTSHHHHHQSTHHHQNQSYNNNRVEEHDDYDDQSVYSQKSSTSQSTTCTSFTYGSQSTSGRSVKFLFSGVFSTTTPNNNGNDHEQHHHYYYNKGENDCDNSYVSSHFDDDNNDENSCVSSVQQYNNINQCYKDDNNAINQSLSVSSSGEDEDEFYDTIMGSNHSRGALLQLHRQNHHDDVKKKETVDLPSTIIVTPDSTPSSLPLSSRKREMPNKRKIYDIHLTTSQKNDESTIHNNDSSSSSLSSFKHIVLNTTEKIKDEQQRQKLLTVTNVNTLLAEINAKRMHEALSSYQNSQKDENDSCSYLHLRPCSRVAMKQDEDQYDDNDFEVVVEEEKGSCSDHPKVDLDSFLSLPNSHGRKRSLKDNNTNNMKKKLTFESNINWKGQSEEDYSLLSSSSHLLETNKIAFKQERQITNLVEPFCQRMEDVVANVAEKKNKKKGNNINSKKRKKDASILFENPNKIHSIQDSSSMIDSNTHALHESEGNNNEIEEVDSRIGRHRSISVRRNNGCNDNECRVRRTQLETNYYDLDNDFSEFIKSVSPIHQKKVNTSYRPVKDEVEDDVEEEQIVEDEEEEQGVNVLLSMLMSLVSVTLIYHYLEGHQYLSNLKHALLIYFTLQIVKGGLDGMRVLISNGKEVKD